MTSEALTIAEAAEMTGLSAHTLRYYERAGLMIAVDRGRSGHRRYGERDLGWIELITKLRATGMPIRDIRRYAALVRAGEGNEGERLDLLRTHRDRVRAQLAATREHLSAIEAKIGYYADAMQACESPDSFLIPPRPATAAAPR